MEKIWKYIVPAILCISLASCIKNDVPYPLVVPQISELSIPDAREVIINQSSRCITAVLPEDADIQNVRVSKLVLADKVTTCVPSMEGKWNLTTPKSFKFKNYDEYDWTLKAQQNIERYFTVKGQVGASAIDVENKRVCVSLSKKVRLYEAQVKTMKLGPAGVSTYSKTIDQIKNLENGEELEITAHGRTEKWLIYGQYSDSSIDFTAVNAWTKRVWLEANGVEGQENGFFYRVKGAQEWIPAKNIRHEGGNFSCCVDGLQPLTSYEVYAFTGSENSDIREFTTEGEEELPNAGLNVYSNAEDSKYQSFFDPAHALWNKKWWDSGNSGSTLVGANGVICSVDLDEKSEGIASARLNSRYVVIKFAAGNLFTGEFAGLVGTKGGKVNFGRPWHTRPASLKFDMKYICGNIDYIDEVPAGTNIKMGDSDCAEIYIALGKWDYKTYGGTPDSPVQVNTTDKASFFDPNGDDVIAYGNYIISSSTNGWQQVEIPLSYKSLDQQPTHIIISCASSRYGDYFTGSSSSVLWIDNFRLEY